MVKHASGALLPNLRVTLGPDAPLHLQIYRRIRSAILAGSLAPGSRLPSTRTLATDLGVSRNTAEEAFSQLEAEGYLVRQIGDGTYVAHILPEHPMRPSPARAAERSAQPLAGRRSLSTRGQAIANARACAEPTRVRAFAAGLPAFDAFPLETWHRLVARRLRQSGRDLLGYGQPAGYEPLREAVAAYLGTARGVTCEPRQVIILTSSQQALDLAARLLLDPGDAVWLEEPGYMGARAALQAAGARIVPVRVDASGLNVAEGQARALDARLAYVTPSHQYPVGVTMSLERRLALLAWAEHAGAWILEDDYDSEFRYTGRPLAAIQGLDVASRVLYVGTFTKVMFPSLRLAYLVAPKDLVEAFVTARSLIDGHTPTLLQAVLTDFMVDGHFATHVRRMRALYQERRDVFLAAAERELAGRVQVGPAEAGLHVTGYLPAGRDDRAVSRRATASGLDISPLSRYYVGSDPASGLVLGYAGLLPAAIRQGLRTLAKVL